VKAIVVAGGDAAAEDAAHLVGADLVIAADSGAEWLAARGIRPDVVIGDMDSIDPALLERLAADGVTIERHPTDKEASDAELAVDRAVESGATEVVLLGAVGGERLDHQLANLFLIGDPRLHRTQLRIVSGGTSVRTLHDGDNLTLEGGEGALVTLLSIDGDAVGVRTHGLRYPLDGETLQLGRSRGLSNVVLHPPASVSLERGTLLVIEMRKEAPR
jgi:thiamine pyrophosphokinase